MSNFRESIKIKIQDKRPNLNPNSVKTYTSILFNLYKRIENNDKNEISFFNDDKRILENLKENTPATRKTILSALFILTGIDAYKSLMLADCKVVNDNYKLQKKSPKEKENWLEMDTIKKLYEEHLQKCKDILNKKIIGSYPEIINCLLIGCLGGVSGLPPRRSLDYADMKVRNYTTKKDNYYKGGKFYFNVYKTAEKYGEQVLDVKQLAPDFNNLIIKWVKSNPTDYLLFSTNQNKLSSPQITRMFNKLFGKRVSVDMIRHIYLSDKFKNVPALEEMQELSEQMSHGLSQQMLYVKKS